MQALGVQVVLLVAIFALTHVGLTAGIGWLGLVSPADPAGLPWLALVLTGLGLLATPLGAAWSRRLEREADADALGGDAGAGGLRRGDGAARATEPWPERRPNRLKERLFATHPPLEERIAAARAVERRLAGGGHDPRTPRRAPPARRSGRWLCCPGAYDGVSARLVERAGFEAVYMTGYGTAASRLGLPDLGFAGLAVAGRPAAMLVVVPMPLPDRATVVGLLLALLVTVSVPVRVPDAVGRERDRHRAGRADGERRAVVGLAEVAASRRRRRRSPRWCRSW